MTRDRYAHRNTPGFRIWWHRDKQKMSQKVLAEKAGVSTTALSRIESGQSYPSFTTAILICRALNIDPGWVYDGKVTCKREHELSVPRGTVDSAR